MCAQNAAISLPENPLLPGEGPAVLSSDACSVVRALMHLKNYRDVPLTVAQAITYLRQFDGPRPLHRLYQVYFPLEWACSTASISSNMSGGYSPREEEFLRLVGFHLFPLDSDYLLDSATGEESLDRIELLPYASNWWEVDEIDHTWLILMLVSGMLHPEEAIDQLQALEEISSSLREALAAFILTTDGYYSLQPLRPLCRAVAGPLCHLPVTLEMLRYETGNEWLDITGEDGALPFDRMRLHWCEKDLDFLTHTFRAAQEIERQAHTLIEWLKADLDAHLWETLALLEQALTPLLHVR